MAGTSPLDLFVLCEELLDAATDALNTIPLADPLLLGAPDRRFVNPGLPAFDCCDQLTVHTDRVADAATLAPALSPGKRHTLGKKNVVSLIITSTRCIPTGVDGPAGTFQLPEPAELSASAEQINADGWALWNHIYNLLAAGDLLSRCSNVVFDGLVSVPPQGGCGGWTLTISAQYDGYTEALGS